MEWKKIGTIAIAIMALTTIGIAYSIGDKLSPTQFANYDLDKHAFNPKPAGNQVIGTGEGALYRMTATIESFTKNNVLEYEATTQQVFAQYGIREYAACRQAGNTKAQCVAQIKETGIQQLASRIESERTRLKNQQETAEELAAYANELKPEDVSISAGEINAAVNAQQQAQP